MYKYLKCTKCKELKTKVNLVQIELRPQVLLSYLSNALPMELTQMLAKQLLNVVLNIEIEMHACLLSLYYAFLKFSLSSHFHPIVLMMIFNIFFLGQVI